MMNEFKTQSDLLMGYTVYLMQSRSMDKEAAKCLAQMSYKYSPIFYRGGFVIPGFGYSTERIGIHVSAEEAGNPELIQERFECNTIQ